MEGELAVRVCADAPAKTSEDVPVEVGMAPPKTCAPGLIEVRGLVLVGVGAGPRVFRSPPQGVVESSLGVVDGARINQVGFRFRQLGICTHRLGACGMRVSTHGEKANKGVHHHSNREGKLRGRRLEPQLTDCFKIC